MSTGTARTLPARPSKEHLRKEAKRWAKDRRLGLAEAHCQVAASYGFGTWAALIRRVDALRGGQQPAVRLFVDDIVAARRFYADLLGLRPIDTTRPVLIFDAGPLLIIEPADEEARREGLVGRFAGVSFAVSDIQALHARLAAQGCTITGPPDCRPLGASRGAAR